jgi:hypothetical protein
MDPSFRRTINSKKAERGDLSVGQLREELDSEAFVRGSPERIAVFELLHEYEKKEKTDILDIGERHHRERHWWTRLTAVTGIVIALASFLSARLWPTGQVEALAHRVDDLEKLLLVPRSLVTPKPNSTPQPSLEKTVEAPALSIEPRTKIPLETAPKGQ